MTTPGPKYGPCSHSWETDDNVCPECGADWTYYFRGQPPPRAVVRADTDAGLRSALELLKEAVERGWVSPRSFTNQPDDPWLTWQMRYLNLSAALQPIQREPEPKEIK